MHSILKASLIASSLALASTAAVAHGDDPAAKKGKLGAVLFKTSCSAEAQKQFERALAMLHSFYFPETVKAFSAIAETDPACAIAYWGIAVSQRPNPLVGPFDAATLKRGLDAVMKGEAIGAKTERERDWLGAVKAFYQDYETVDQATRTANYEKAMAALAKKYPGDVEAKVFHALALNEVFDHKDFKPLLQAISILAPLDRKYPAHPGITHYLIHSYDFAPIAKKGIPAADKYAKIAPAAPHAQHMPSHIYSMVGMWEKSIEANIKSVAISDEYAAKNKLDGRFPGVMHAWDFMQYAYLQLGQDAKAKALMEENAAVPKIFNQRITSDTGIAAIPARYMLERQDWKGAAGLEAGPLLKAPVGRAIVHFARAMGAARSGDVARANTDIEAIKGFREELLKAKQSYWAEQVEVQVLGAQAWVYQAEGKRDEALKFMRAAADLEDGSEKHVAMENHLYPMRELLGDMLREHGRHAEALKEYEVSMKNAPNRLRGWYGAAMAAKESGEAKKAAGYLGQLARLTRKGDGARAELRELKQVLAAK